MFSSVLTLFLSLDSRFSSGVVTFSPGSASGNVALRSFVKCKKNRINQLKNLSLTATFRHEHGVAVAIPGPDLYHSGRGFPI